MSSDATPEPARSGEFERIRRFFAPLAGAAGLGLTDDAALIRAGIGDLVITTDALVAGVHFIGDEPADLIARKALRVNLSDLAAMGAEPEGYTLALALPHHLDDAWLGCFAEGLAADQAEYAITLIGGDTVATPGPLTLSITALGRVPAEQMLRRSGARPGDVVAVTGTIGDAALGLDLLQRRLALDPASSGFLIGRYRLPRPRTALGPKLRGLASAALDVSDGLAADLGHIAAASGVRIVIDADRVPLSDAARTARANGASVERILAGGDDYELALTFSPGRSETIFMLAEAIAVPLTRIGRVEVGQGVHILDCEGQAIRLGCEGYRHS